MISGLVSSSASFGQRKPYDLRFFLNYIIIYVSDIQYTHVSLAVTTQNTHKMITENGCLSKLDNVLEEIKGQLQCRLLVRQT